MKDLFFFNVIEIFNLLELICVIGYVSWLDITVLYVCYN